MIYVDDLGYGDLGCYGADHIQTPNLDALAASGIRFTDCHSPSATSTPSRYSLMTGRYAWRVPGTDVIPGDAALLIDTSEITLPKVFQSAGYNTAAIGKWHLGLGLKKAGQDWNGHVAPGPNEVGFGYSFIIPATGDRVPCVYVENGRVVNLDPSDPIVVDYSKPVPGELVAKEHPELLKQMWSHGHNQALINGIGRIGYMGGGKSALWEDEKIAGTLADKAVFHWPSPYHRIMTLRDAFFAGELYHTDVPASEGQKYPEKKRKVMELVPMGGYWRDLPDDVAREYMGGSYGLAGGKTGMARRLSLDEPSLTLTCAPAQKQTERCHPVETRPLTVREYARIQTFPDEWVFAGNLSSKYKQIGNAVPVNLAYAVGRSLVRLLNDIETALE